MGTPLTPLK